MNKDFYISLIARKLSNELSASQLKDLSSWLSSSKDNARLMDDFKSVWNLSSGYAQSPAIQVDQAFEKFSGRFNIPQADPALSKAVARKKLFTKLIYPLIAAIVLSVAATLYFSSLFNSNKVVNDNMHAMTFQLDAFSEMTMAPRSAFKKGSAEKLSSQDMPAYEELFSMAENSGEVNMVKEGYYQAVKADFTPSSENFIIEDFNGQGFFELKSINENQAFLGLGMGLSVGAHDASFNLQNYKGENLIIDVQKGTIVLYDSNSNAFFIHEGERAVYIKSEGVLKAESRSDASPFKWHKGILIFNNTPLPEAFNRIEKFYGVDIEVTDGSSLEGLSPFTSTLSMSNNLNDCLSLLQESYNMTIRRKGLRKIEISDIVSD